MTINDLATADEHDFETHTAKTFLTRLFRLALNNRDYSYGPLKLGEADAAGRPAPHSSAAARTTS